MLSLTSEIEPRRYRQLNSNCPICAQALLEKILKEPEVGSADRRKGKFGSVHASARVSELEFVDKLKRTENHPDRFN
jgi:hypothetical protein